MTEITVGATTPRAYTQADINILKDYAEKGERVKYYSYIRYEMGDVYGQLALDVVNDYGFEGKSANAFLRQYSANQGINISDAKALAISKDLMLADFALRSGIFDGSITKYDSPILNHKAIRDYHNSVFVDKHHIPKEAWTAEILMSLTPETGRADLWNMMLNDSDVGKLTTTMYVLAKNSTNTQALSYFNTLFGGYDGTVADDIAVFGMASRLGLVGVAGSAGYTVVNSSILRNALAGMAQDAFSNLKSLVVEDYGRTNLSIYQFTQNDSNLKNQIGSEQVDYTTKLRSDGTLEITGYSKDGKSYELDQPILVKKEYDSNGHTIGVITQKGNQQTIQSFTDSDKLNNEMLNKHLDVNSTTNFKDNHGKEYIVKSVSDVDKLFGGATIDTSSVIEQFGENVYYVFEQGAEIIIDGITYTAEAVVGAVDSASKSLSNFLSLNHKTLSKDINESLQNALYETLGYMASEMVAGRQVDAVEMLEMLAEKTSLNIVTKGLTKTEIAKELSSHIDKQLGMKGYGNAMMSAVIGFALRAAVNGSDWDRDDYIKNGTVAVVNAVAPVVVANNDNLPHYHYKLTA